MSEENIGAPVRQESTGGGVVDALRLVALLVVVAGFAQPVFAGLYLNGSAGALLPHGIVGDTLTLVTLIQLVLAAVHVWRGGGERIVFLAALLVFLATAGTSVAGRLDAMAMHVPLAVVSVSVQLLFVVWLYARLSRSRTGQGAVDAG